MSTPSTDQMQGMLGRSFGVVLAFGLASIALGIILMVFTEQSVVFFAVIIGIYLILSRHLHDRGELSSRDRGQRACGCSRPIAGSARVLLGHRGVPRISQAVGDPRAAHRAGLGGPWDRRDRSKASQTQVCRRAAG